MHETTRRSGSLTTRRGFLKRMGTTAGVVSAPWLVPATVFGASAPSNRIHVALIGCGNQSRGDLPGVMRYDDVQVVAVCDINKGSYGYARPEHFLGREPVRQKVGDYYAKRTRSGRLKGCDAYADFRDVLARDDIDAVAIVTPDHWHRVMTVMAAEAGKDTFCQKPLSLTVRDGQEMIKAVRKHKRILQTGSQFRSSPANRFGCELVRNGRIGELKTIRTFLAFNNKKGPGPGWQPMPVPDGFDYDRWPAPRLRCPITKIAASTSSALASTIPAAKSPISAPIRTTWRNGAMARVLPGRWRSRDYRLNGLRREACSTRR